mmetsp:Transcript_14191/g.38470  ORF Transcript_14191/g.38470 Transcript_14191/m.38470 type:complete len:268 (+) Transcript_14191:2010-2813(+)
MRAPSANSVLRASSSSAPSSSLHCMPVLCACHGCCNWWGNPFRVPCCSCRFWHLSWVAGVGAAGCTTSKVNAVLLSWSTPFLTSTIRAGLKWSMMAHCLATLIAVRTWSPVTIAVRMDAACRCAMVGALSGLSLFTMSTRPIKAAPASSSSWDMRSAVAGVQLAGSCREAMPMTRKPWLVYSCSSGTKLSGTVAGSMKASSLSGEPLTCTASRPSGCMATLVQRSRSDEKSKRLSTCSDSEGGKGSVTRWMPECWPLTWPEPTSSGL